MVFPTEDDFEEYVERFKKRGNSEEFILRRRREFPLLVNLFNNAPNDEYEKVIIKQGQFLSDVLIEYGINLKRKE